MASGRKQKESSRWKQNRQSSQASSSSSSSTSSLRGQHGGSDRHDSDSSSGSSQCSRSSSTQCLRNMPQSGHQAISGTGGAVDSTQHSANAFNMADSAARGQASSAGPSHANHPFAGHHRQPPVNSNAAWSGGDTQSFHAFSTGRANPVTSGGHSPWINTHQYTPLRALRVPRNQVPLPVGTVRQQQYDGTDNGQETSDSEDETDSETEASDDSAEESGSDAEDSGDDDDD